MTRHGEFNDVDSNPTPNVASALGSGPGLKFNKSPQLAAAGERPIADF